MTTVDKKPNVSEEEEEEEESDDMGPTRVEIKKMIKKKKRNITKQEELEDSVSIIENEKKLKKEKKTKQKATPKRKAPLDLDRQCGVLITPNNHPCTRSLTCKIHAMGAKRSVEGRSQPFNDLLAAYQKKGIGRPQVPGTMHDKDSTRSKLNALDLNKLSPTTINNNITTTTTTTSVTTSTKKPCTITCTNYTILPKQEEPEVVDSDEETESVRIAIEQTKPIPLGRKQLFYVGRKRKYFKLRDILLEAITPKDSSSISSSATI
ncbi:SCA7, zinc-binding domain-containing protein [Pilaira anomala]|nr:SCA7, zinc-binding domain-containing protein [Pilaira anomala]